ncbi:hypothetical protein T11_5426, partial [Trichinella zimbabwensis]
LPQQQSCFAKSMVNIGACSNFCCAILSLILITVSPVWQHLMHGAGVVLKQRPSTAPGKPVKPTILLVKLPIKLSRKLVKIEEKRNEPLKPDHPWSKEGQLIRQIKHPGHETDKMLLSYAAIISGNPQGVNQREPLDVKSAQAVSVTVKLVAQY